MDHGDTRRTLVPGLLVPGLLAALAMSCGSSEHTYSLDVGSDDGGSGRHSDGSGLLSGMCTSITGCGVGDGGGSDLGPPKCDAGTGKACICSGCPAGSCTTISGTVYDPAGNNPLYGVTVFVASGAASLLPMPQGAACVGCADLFPRDLLADANTD